MMTLPVAETAHSCLDLLRISWGSNELEPKQTVGTLLEVSRSGGLLHIDEGIAPGTKVNIYLPDGQQISAEVQSFEQDEFGYYVALQISGAWFPVQYWPEYMLPDSPPPKPPAGIDAELAASIPEDVIVPSVS
jgi:hypothetical protein